MTKRESKDQEHRKDQSIGRLISILHRQASVYFHKKLNAYGLGHGQMPVLMYIIHHDGATQHEVSQHFSLDRGSTSGLIKRLEEGGFITRQRDEGDRRVFKLHITRKTKDLLPVFYEIFHGWTRILLDGFNEKEQEQAFELLNRMLGNTRHHLRSEEGP